ncbi:MAG: hypothetical protein JWM68_4167 [Verrucomicrobiales bacterium]|nr:hypothetical protein [Verrucomicrobiales bacterium]
MGLLSRIAAVKSLFVISINHEWVEFLFAPKLFPPLHFRFDDDANSAG